MPGKKLRKQSENANDSSSIPNDGIDSADKGDDSAVSKVELFNTFPLRLAGSTPSMISQHWMH